MKTIEEKLGNSNLELYKKFLTSSTTCRSERALADYLLGLAMFCRMIEGDVFDVIKDYRAFHEAIEKLVSCTSWPDGRPKKKWASLTTYKTATECIVFFKWAHAFGLTKNQIHLDQPQVGHLFKKGHGKPADYFDWTDPVLQKLLYDPNNSVKRRAMYQLMRASGIRPCEFELLKLEHYGGDVISIPRRKGGDIGFVPVDAEAQSSLNEYIACLKRHYDGPWLFPKDDYSGPINRHGLWKMMSNHGKKHDTRFNAYMLRHSLPGELAKRGKNAFTISAVMGHKDPRTTAIYFHLSKQATKEIYNQESATA